MVGVRCRKGMIRGARGPETVSNASDLGQVEPLTALWKWTYGDSRHRVWDSEVVGLQPVVGRKAIVRTEGQALQRAETRGG